MDGFLFLECGYNGGTKMILVPVSQEPAKVPVVLFNYLSLKDEGRTPAKKTGGLPDPRMLFSRLINRAFKAKNISPLPDINWENLENLMLDVCIKQNRTGSPVQFIHDEQDKGKVDSLIFSLCENLDIKLCHGWIETPGDPDNVGQRQLTSYGLNCLTEEIEEGTPALLFWNGNLSVVHKHQGDLYLLETDINTLQKQPQTMWRSLSLHEHEEILFTSLFVPLPLSSQPNVKEDFVVKFMKRWEDARDREIRFLIDESSKEEKPSKNAGRTKKKKTGDKHGDVQEHGSPSENKESTAAQSTEIPRAGHIDDVDEHKWVKEKFKDFLETFIDRDDDAPEQMPFYVTMVEGLKNLPAKKRPFPAIIYYPHIELHDATLALAILNDRTRLYDVLSEVFLDFMVNQNGGKKEQLKKKVKIRILGMPPAGSTCRFEEFLESNNTELAELHMLYDGKTLSSATYIGRRAGKGYVDYLLENHRAGKSWNGNFSKSDMAIKDGRFEILTPANEDATSQSMREDFVKLSKLFLALYQKGSAPPPVYFDAFEEEVFHMDKFDINKQEFKVFQRYLSHHLAFKAPLVRAALFTDIWTAIQSERTIDEKSDKRVPFHKLKTYWREGNEKIYTLFSDGWFFDKVYHHGYLSEYKYFQKINFLELIRHLEVHLTDHTRIDGKQLLPDFMLVDLMIGQTFGRFASNLVYNMMIELDDAQFSNSWRHYEMFECGDELQKTVSESGRKRKCSQEV